MAKGKSVSHAGPHKSHGPKRHTFNEYGNRCIRTSLGTAQEFKMVPNAEGDLKRVDIKPANLFSKYWCKESWLLSCAARGLKAGTKEDWDARWRYFFTLPDNKAKDEWLKNCKNWKPETKKKEKAILAE